MRKEKREGERRRTSSHLNSFSNNHRVDQAHPQEAFS